VIHSARWDHDYDLAGKRVAIVGTGASAVQIIPSVAKDVARLDVYQRTPIWISPKPDPKIPDRVKRLFARLPITQRITRNIASAITEFIIIFMPLRYDRFRSSPARSSDATGDSSRARCVIPSSGESSPPTTGWMQAPGGVEQLPACVQTATNVDLVTEPIDRITPGGVRTAGGEERAVDAIILATRLPHGLGSRELPSEPRPRPRRLRPRDALRGAPPEGIRERQHARPSQPLHDLRAYGWTGASWHVLVQTASTHITRVLGEARRRDATCVEVSEEATDHYHAGVLERMGGSVWFSGRCANANSYYFDHHGDVPYLRPSSAREARRAARSFPLDDYRYATLARHGADRRRRSR